MSFHVLPANLHGSGDDLEDLGELMRDVLTYSETYVEVTADHADVGTFFLDVKNRTNQLQDQLRRNYSVLGPVTGWYHAAGEALHAAARDYESVDQATAASWDRLISCPPEPNHDFSLPPYSGIDISEIRAKLTPPTGWTEIEQNWQQAQDVIDYVFGLEWVAHIFVPPVGDPFRGTLEDLRERFNGPWMEVGRAAAGLHTLGDVNHEMNIRVALAAQNLSWHGNAADNAKDNIDRFREVMDEHVGNLHSVAEFLNIRAYTMVKIMDVATSLLEMVMDLATYFDGMDLIQLFRDSAALSTLARILELIPLVTLCWDLLGALLGGIGLTFHALFDRDVAVPAINPPTGDVGAPA